MRRFLKTMVILAVALAAAACSIVGGSGGAGGTIDGTSWRLTQYLSSGTLIAVEEGYVVDATFAGGQVHGFSGCNSYNGPATVSGSTIAIGPLATTGRLCKMAIPIEQDYLAALPTAASFTATADSLTLFDGSGKTILV